MVSWKARSAGRTWRSATSRELTLGTIAHDHLSLQELRTDRPALSAEEDRVSYWRRIVQARLDVLHTPGAGPADRLAL